MKVKGFINIYPSKEAGAGSSTSFLFSKSTGERLKTGSAFFDTTSLADKAALPSRLAVAAFEYDKEVDVIRYRNVYKGSPYSWGRAEEFSCGDSTFVTEAEALKALEGSIWKVYHIGVLRVTEKI